MSAFNPEPAWAVAQPSLSPSVPRPQGGLVIQRNPVNPRLIYDVGAHLGEDTEFYLKKGFKVVAVEGNPCLAKKLTERFQAQIADGSLTVVAHAIAETAGEVGFYVNERSEWGTLHRSFAAKHAHLGSPSNLIQVRAVRFHAILAEYGIPYYLKIDVEDSDALCLEGLLEIEERPRYISIESELRSWKAVRREFELFALLGYTKFKIVDQKRVCRSSPPKPAAEGHYVEHRFPRGASGLFGRELPGEWLTREQALRRYRFICLRHCVLGDSGLLCRAMLSLLRLGSAVFGKTSILKNAGNTTQRSNLFEPLFLSHGYDTHAML